MYPRVKVRQYENDLEEEKELMLKGVRSLYLLDQCSSSVAMKNFKKIENERLNIRATSVPPPRAILSSPENDVLIGKTKPLLKDRLSASRTNSSAEKTPIQHKDGITENGKMLTNERPRILKKRSVRQNTPQQGIQKMQVEGSPLDTGSSSVLKMPVLREATPAQTKVTPKSVKPLNPLNTRRIFKGSEDTKSNQEASSCLHTTIPRQKLYFRKGKLTPNENASLR